jgi:hypothetical protein
MRLPADVAAHAATTSPDPLAADHLTAGDEPGDAAAAEPAAKLRRLGAGASGGRSPPPPPAPLVRLLPTIAAPPEEDAAGSAAVAALLAALHAEGGRGADAGPCSDDDAGPALPAAPDRRRGAASVSALAPFQKRAGCATVPVWPRSALPPLHAAFMEFEQGARARVVNPVGALQASLGWLEVGSAA